MTTRVVSVNVGQRKPTSSLEAANQSAANLSKSQYGYAITTKNPFDDKQLEQKLKEIEKEQKMKYAEMFWKQRQFFIENAFDDDDKLRFVKLKSQRLESRSSLPLIQVKTPSSRSSNNSSESPRKSKIRMSSAYFPKIVEDDRPVTSVQKSKIFKKQKTLKELKNRSDLIPSPMFGTSPDFRPTREESVLRDNPVLLPIRDETNEDTAEQISKNKKKKRNRKNCSNSLPKDKNSCEFDDTNFSMPVRDNLRLAEVDDAAIFDALQKNNEMHINISNIMSGDETRASKSLLKSQSTASLTTDELLLKLTKSLPMRLLLKTDETLTNLSSALGFDEQRHKLIEREKSIVSKSALEDDRFKKLMNSLTRQEAKLGH